MSCPDPTGGAYLGEGGTSSPSTRARDLLRRPRAALDVITARLTGSG